MQSKLLYPHPWEERKPALSQGVLFIPKHYTAHGLQEPLFPSQREICIEYCSGNGAWVLNKAKAYPECYWVAVEQKFERAQKIWRKKEKEQMNNLLIVCGEALTFTKYYLPESCISQVYLNFPDPWPKTKHAKNRLVQKPFVEELARVVKQEGKTTFVTDDEPYAEQMVREMCASSFWRSTFPDPFFVLEWPEYGTSYFDALWREKGRAIRYMNFERYACK